MINSLHFLKTRSIPKFYVCLVFCALLNDATGAPFIEWVSPPAWVETRLGNEPAQAGMPITGQTLITTGRAGKVLVRLDQEQVELHENSMWEWQDQGSGSTGNAMQGRVRVGSPSARSLPLEGGPMGDGPVRLYANAPWTLILEAGEQEVNAQRLALFLRKSGYPVKAEQSRETKGAVTWQLLLAGFMSSEAAIAMGTQLMALAPGIVSATYQHQSPKTINDTTVFLRFSDDLNARSNSSPLSTKP